jgi:hypothetical protein
MYGWGWLVRQSVFPRLRTQPYGCFVYALPVVWLVLWRLWSVRFAPASGFYALDDAGRPVRFLSKSSPPATLFGRTGTGRKAFVRQASAAVHSS